MPDANDPASSRPDASDTRDPLETVAEELFERRRRGEQPSLSEYVARRPELADRIAAIFPALMDLEDAGKEERPAEQNRDLPPVRVGDFQVLREIARGGMGVVYEAVQVSLGRRVALKVMSASRLGDERLVERFRREARSAARLHHSNIVPVYGSGEADGVLFYAMQLIDGRNLAEVLEEVRRQRQAGDVPLADSSTHLDGTRPDYFQRVALIGQQVALALEHAHGEGVLHRDIKPSNLLLDARGNVWVTDFGLAKAEGSTELTHSGDVVGTLSYLAPERLKGWSDPGSDTYALGIVLYEMLTLRRAFPQTARAEVLEAIARRDPPPPRRVEASIPRDLETIVLKAIDKNPAYRYATARELADDLGRFLAIRPIQARRPGAVHRAWRWCQRSPYTAGFAATSAALLVLLAAGSILYSFRVTEERNAALEAQGKAAERLLDSRIASARWRRQAGWAGQRFDSLKELQEVAATRKDAAVATEVLASFGSFDFEVESEHGLDHWSVAIAPSFETYAIGQDDGSVAIRRLSDGSPVSRIPAAADAADSVQSMRFSPSGALLGAGLKGPRGFEISIVDLESRRQVWRASSPGLSAAIDFERGDRWAVLRGDDGAIQVVSLTEPEREPRRLPLVGAPLPEALRLDPSGRWVASLAAEGQSCSVLVWDVQRGALDKVLAHGGWPMDMSWHPSGELLAVACSDYLVYLWEVAGERLVKRLGGHRAEVVHASFSPDGKVLATASWDGESRFWDATTWSLLVHGLGEFIAWRPDGLAAAYRTGSRRIGTWKMAHGDELRRVRYSAAAKGPQDIAIAPEGDLVAAAGGGVQVALASGGRSWTLTAAPAAGVAFLPDGRGLLAGADRLLFFPLERAGAVARFREPHMVLPQGGPLGLAPDGRFVACAARSGVIWLTDLEHRSDLRTLGRIDSVTSLAVSRGGRFVAAAKRFPLAVQILDGRTGAQLKGFAWGGGRLAFSADDRRLFVCAADTIQALEVGTWEVLWSRPRLEGGDSGGGIAPLEGTPFVIAASSRAQVTLHDRDSGSEVLHFGLAGQQHLRSLAAAGAMLAVGSTSGYIQLWDLAQVSRELASVGIEVPLAPRASPAAPVAASIVAPPVVEPSRPRWIENVEGLTLALQAGPESSELHAQRAEAFLAGGQRVEAIADLGRALERKPGDAASLHLRRASLLESLGRFAEALDDLERGLEIDPGSLDLLRARAAVLDRSGREVEAVRDLERVLTASPGDAAAAEALAWILLTGPAGLRDAGRAVELARRAAADRPDLVHVQRTLGAACLRAGLIAEAREACERALTLPGGDSSPSIWLYLAMVRARTGDLDGARLALGKGQRRTADPNRRRALGPCYVRRLEELLAEARAVLEVAARPSGGP